MFFVSIKVFHYLSAFAYSICTTFFIPICPIYSIICSYVLFKTSFSIVQEFSLANSVSNPLQSFIQSFLFKPKECVFRDYILLSFILTYVTQALHIYLCRTCLNMYLLPESILCIFSLPYIMPIDI